LSTTPASARCVFQQLVSALDYCHSLSVYHRDIKPNNILVDTTSNIKAADFALLQKMIMRGRIFY
jgi:5'-AMP-activated protein kinase catalytic alpha subunit